MLHISSRDNPLYKHLKRLAQGRAGRRSASDADSGPVLDGAMEAGPGRHAAVLEGVHLCQEWIQHRGQPVRAVFDVQRLQSSAELRDLASHVHEHHAVSMESSLVQSISAVAKGQGVVFLVHHDIPAPPGRIDHACLWLDRIQDPGNVGTLLRTAAAAGIKHAYLSDECASAWSPRVLRSAQGAHFVMTLYEQVDLLAALGRLSVPLCAATLREDAVSLYQCELPARCAWVFGNEGQGVDPKLLAEADRCFYIPQDNAVESLNVGVAAGICLFEQRRQHASTSPAARPG